VVGVFTMKVTTSSYKTAHRWARSIFYMYFCFFKKKFKHVGKIIAPHSSLLDLTLESIWILVLQKVTIWNPIIEVLF